MAFLVLRNFFFCPLIKEKKDSFLHIYTHLLNFFAALSIIGHAYVPSDLLSFIFAHVSSLLSSSSVCNVHTEK